MRRGGRAGGFYMARVGRSLLCEEGMLWFGGMHVTLALGSHYSSWVSRRDNRAPYHRATYNLFESGGNIVFPVSNREGCADVLVLQKV